MRISPIKTTIKRVAICSALCAGGVLGCQYKKDVDNAHKIKKELLEYPAKGYLREDLEMEIECTEIFEPFFNKTEYWEVEASRIREELDERRQRKEHFDSIFKRHTVNP